MDQSDTPRLLTSIIETYHTLHSRLGGRGGEIVDVYRTSIASVLITHRDIVNGKLREREHLIFDMLSLGDTETNRLCIEAIMKKSNEEIENKNNLIESLQQQLQYAHKEIDDTRTAIINSNNEKRICISDLESQISDMRNTIQGYQTRTNQMSNEINSLNMIININKGRVESSAAESVSLRETTKALESDLIAARQKQIESSMIIKNKQDKIEALARKLIMLCKVHHDTLQTPSHTTHVERDDPQELSKIKESYDRIIREYDGQFNEIRMRLNISEAKRKEMEIKIRRYRMNDKNNVG
eukprot:GHVO01013108.1.p1 GENE.GHVO01013108.1~~GHVO01013108.1.p1  ORF type:complete len:323 (-),score=71.35 GHVO01013108.1:41-934(-)